MEPKHRNARLALRACEMKKFGPDGGGILAKVTGLFKGFGALVKMNLFRLKPEKAADAAEAYLVNDPTNVYVLVQLGKALERAGYLEPAADAFEFAHQRRPNDLGVLWRLGDALASLGEYEKSIRCFQALQSRRPNDRDIAERLRAVSAESHLKRSHLEEAQSFREHLRDEKMAKELAQAERMMRSSDAVDQELARHRKAIEENPNDAEAHMRLGDALARSDRFAEAEGAYRKAFEIGKRWPAREKFGDMRLRLLEKAEERAQQQAEESGRDPASVAQAQEAKRKRLEFAIKEFELRRKQHPTETRLAWQLGQYYFELGGEAAVRQAIQQFQQAMNSVPLKLGAQLMLGRCFALNPKTLDMAKEQFLKAYETMENDQSDMAKSLLYELGVAAEKMGNKPEALTWYKKIFAVDAGYRDVAQKIQQLG
jgi:tetratricopeptide (TPR) repeat protein